MLASTYEKREIAGLEQRCCKDPQMKSDHFWAKAFLICVAVGSIALIGYGVYLKYWYKGSVYSLRVDPPTETNNSPKDLAHRNEP